LSFGIFNLGMVAKQKLRGVKSILRGDDVSRGSNNDDDDDNDVDDDVDDDDECYSSCDRSVGKAKNDRSSSSLPSNSS